MKSASEPARVHWLASLAGFLRDHNGKLSAGRIAILVLALALAYVIIATRSVPGHTIQMAYVFAALYGANQLRNALQAFANKQSSQDQAQPQAGE